MILIVAVLSVMSFQAYAATAKETVEAGVNKVLTTLSDPTFKAKPKDVKTQFREILAKESPQKLLKILRNKVSF
jgi:ABC-type transporter MlaC component